jgi:xanthine dehydrogenase accessory factor
MDRVNLAALNEERRTRRPVALVTDTASGDSRLILASDFAGDTLSAEIAQAMGSRSACIHLPERGLFVKVYLPQPRLIIIGAVHIAQSLAAMAAIAELDVAIVDPRGAFASVARFDGFEIYEAWPQDHLAGHPLDARSALVALSHNPDIDDPALLAACKSSAFYIGALGSRKSHAARSERLAKAGLSATDIARIEAPIGLDIGSVTPPEIAVSILASLIAAQRRTVRDLATGGSVAA